MCDHEFTSALDLLTIHGNYLHLYRCTKCGMCDYIIEEVIQDVRPPIHKRA